MRAVFLRAPQAVRPFTPYTILRKLSLRAVFGALADSHQALKDQKLVAFERQGAAKLMPYLAQVGSFDDHKGIGYRLVLKMRAVHLLVLGLSQRSQERRSRGFLSSVQRTGSGGSLSESLYRSLLGCWAAINSPLLHRLLRGSFQEAAGILKVGAPRLMKEGNGPGCSGRGPASRLVPRAAESAAAMAS